MAVKATASITVSHERDISSVWRFYRITSSATTPTAPTEAQGKAFINSGTAIPNWSTTEPTYDGTSTNSLYICDLTAFSNGDVSWSPVSKSSAYEAAKQAYNKAESAAEAAEQTAQYFWHKSGDDDEAGAHITEIPAEEFIQNPSGGNILIRSNVLKLRMALITLAELTGTSFKFYDPVTHEERLTINADGIYLKGKLITGTYSYARLQSEYFLIAYYNGDRHITSEYFGKGGFGNYLFSRKQIATVGSHPVFSSTVVDEDGLKIIHDDSDTPYDTPLTGGFNTTSASLEDDTLLLQNVDDYGNEYQTVEVSAEDGGGIVITAKDEDGRMKSLSSKGHTIRRTHRTVMQI